MIFSEIKSRIATNLNDAGKVYFTEEDLTNSLQDGYDDIVTLTQCVIKKVTLDWQSDLSYYDFRLLGVDDFMAVTAIYNNVNGRWLQDDLNIVQLDQVRPDWEIWHGTPVWWSFASWRRTAIVPKKEIAEGTFDLFYWATAPAIIDTASPLIAADMQKLLDQYGTGDLLEQAEEYMKAGLWWSPYYELLEKYTDRTKSFAKSDLRNYI